MKLQLVSCLASILLLLGVQIGPGEVWAQANASILFPPPKVGYDKTSGLQTSITTSTLLAVHSQPARRPILAVARLQNIVKGLLGDTLKIITLAEAEKLPQAILLGLAGDGEIDSAIERVLASGELLGHREGYLLDVASSRVLIAGVDAAGAMNGVHSFEQLVGKSGGSLLLNPIHVNDYPDYPTRWVFSQHNLRGTNAVNALRKIADTMSRYKLNGLQQNDFKYSLLEEQPSWYFANADTLLRYARERAIEWIPGVYPIGYSEGLLWHDPNLAEGAEANARYVMEADTGRLIHDARVTFTNGSFENVANEKFVGMNYDGPLTSVFADGAVKHGGQYSALCKDFEKGNPAGNCRFIQTVQCEPHTSYVMTAWLRTEDFNGDMVQLLAIGFEGKRSRVLTATNYSIAATTGGWKKVMVFFNSLDFPNMYLYAGVWGGRSGRIWWDDIEVHEAGLLNVLRRDGAPLYVRSVNRSTLFSEGTDFLPIADQKMLASAGTYPIDHAPPQFRRTPSSRIANGDTVLVSFFQPLTTMADERGVGQSMVCISEEKTDSLLRDQISRVSELFQNKSYMMQHDEIRVLRQDSACLGRNMTAEELLADNINRCHDIIKPDKSTARIYMWSDMIDSLHNAVDNYYLVNGSLKGDWRDVTRDITIVNWNYGNRAKSLDFFEREGFTQITSPYYDERGTSSMRNWRLAMDSVTGVEGMVYTTWSQDYDYLRPFAYYAWGAGPSISHEPLDTGIIGKFVKDGVYALRAEIRPDPFDPSDRIQRAEIEIAGRATEDGPLVTKWYTMTKVAGSEWAGSVDLVPTGHYSITAWNNQGLTRSTPQYNVEWATLASVGSEEGINAFRAYPNPASSRLALNWRHDGKPTEVSLVDALGRRVRIWELQEGVSVHEAENRMELDITGVTPGAYTLLLKMPLGMEAVKLEVRVR